MTRILKVVCSLLSRASDGESLEESRDEIYEWLLNEGVSPVDADLALSLAIRMQDRIEALGEDYPEIRSNRVFLDMMRLRFTPEALGYLQVMKDEGFIDDVQKDEAISRALMSEIVEVDRRTMNAILTAMIEGREWYADSDLHDPPTLH